ncbi:secretin N-terminal domain-containing protein [Aeoliella mucimassa]|nr:secretin N-terminal domain-containing protein [Aeoliella mucimassa]
MAIISPATAQPVEEDVQFFGSDEEFVIPSPNSMQVAPGRPVVIEHHMEQPTEGEAAPPSNPEVPNQPQPEGEKKPDEAAPDGDVKRPEQPPKVADPRELEAKPDSSGKVSFSFNGQMWPDVLQWLANVSGKSLDWTELPAGYLNLTTQRSYTLPEARDLINRQLHARGFTMILNGEVLSIFKIDKLDPSLIPRVDEEDLYDLQPADFVKITFQLPIGMEVAAAAEDVKKTAGEHTKVIPLPSTRRILLITTVAHARLVSSILNEERLAVDGKIVPVEIILKHRRAEKIIDILYVVLGLDPAGRPSQEELAMRQQKMQMLMQMQGQGKDISRMLKQDGPDVYLAYNSHRNSVLINAPPEVIRTIRHTIELLDVPADGGDIDLTAELGHRIPKSYKLETINPTTLQTTLEEIGDLSPLTELRADNKADILFARATEADHAKIEQLIKQLDEAGLETMVFMLRKHPADAVAGTLQTMFAPSKDDKKSNSSRFRNWDPWGYNPYEEEEEPPADVRIDADIENNRLIVRATPEQLQQIRDFLIQLGEPLDEPDRRDHMRVVDSMSADDTAALLQRLRRIWPQMSDNELRIEGYPLEGTTQQNTPADDSTTEPEAEQAIPVEETSAPDREARSSSGKFHFANEQTTATTPPETDDSEPLSEPETVPIESGRPPVVIRVAPDGRLLLFSDDTLALDEAERLIDSVAPPQERFRLFQVKYVTAYSIYLTLKNLYKEEIDGDKTDGYFDQFLWEYIPGQQKRSSPQMSKRKRLKLDWDTGSNTILVANASEDQLREIGTLIEKYDRPSDDEDSKTRRTAAIKLKYSQAKVVAAALKDVYRDLLSSRDKEFETEDKKGAATQRETTTIIRYGQGTGDSDDGKKPTPVKVGFQGALSIGVDEISNIIIISVQEELFESVLQIVQSLDEAASPQTTVAVHSLHSGISPEALKKALSEALGDPWVGGKPEKQRTEGDQQQHPGPGRPGGEHPQPGGGPQPSE